MKKTQKITALIQARTGSRRFPNKVLTKIEGKPMIWHIINRVKETKGIEQIVLITTKKKEDRILIDIAKKNGILWFTGSTNDVLGRYFDSAVKFSADPIIRITGDNPLLDPQLIDKFLKFYLKSNYDYASNTILHTYPTGLDVEIFSFNSLKINYKNAKLKSEREHVTPYIKNHSKKFKIYNFLNKKNLSHFRWTVDEQNDLKFVKKIYSLMKPKKIFYYKDIMKIISKDPSICNINKGIKNNEGYFYSLKHDKKIK